MREQNGRGPVGDPLVACGGRVQAVVRVRERPPAVSPTECQAPSALLATPGPRYWAPGHVVDVVQCAGRHVTQTPKGPAMTEYLIAAVLFVAMVTTLIYLWKREHG